MNVPVKIFENRVKVSVVAAGPTGPKGDKGDPGSKIHRVTVTADEMAAGAGTPTLISLVNGSRAWNLATSGDSVRMTLPRLPADWTSIEIDCIWSTEATTNGALDLNAKIGRVGIGKTMVAPADTNTEPINLSNSNWVAPTPFSTTLSTLAADDGPIAVDPAESISVEIIAGWLFGAGPINLQEIQVRNGEHHRTTLRTNLIGSWWTRPRCTVNSAGKARVTGIKAYGNAVGVNSLVEVDLAVTPPVQTENSLGAYEEDDHNNGALVVPATTKPPIVMWCTHGADNLMRYRIGTTVDSIATLHSQALQTIDALEALTYAEVHGRPTVGSGELHLLTRGDPGWIYFRSTDWGANWSAKQRLWTTGAQDYVASSLMADGRTLRVAAFPHPSSFTDLVGVAHNIWVFEVDLQTGDVTRVGDPTVIANVQTGTGLPLDDTQPAAYEAPAGRTLHLFDVGSGPTPMVVFAEKDLDDAATSEDSVYKLAVHIAGVGWVVRDIATTGQHFGHVFGYYVGGAAHKLNSDDTVYVSREAGGVWTVEKWTTPDLGVNWTTTVLDRLDQPLVRPFAVDGDLDFGEITYYRVHRYDVDVDGNGGYDDNQFYADMIIK